MHKAVWAMSLTILTLLSFRAPDAPLSLAATAKAASATPLILGQTVTVERGKDFSVTLSGTSGSNYEWSYLKSGGGMAALRDARTSVSKQKATGSTYQKTWTFNARKSGTVKLTFSYARAVPRSVERTAVYTVQIIEPKKASAACDLEAKANQTTRVKVGETFCIRQRENPSTGYQWTYKGSGSGSAVFLKRSSVSTSPGTPGAPSDALWMYQAQAPGIYKLTFIYARPWEKSSSDKAVVYTIEIVK